MKDSCDFNDNKDDNDIGYNHIKSNDNDTNVADSNDVNDSSDKSDDNDNTDNNETHDNDQSSNNITIINKK